MKQSKTTLKELTHRYRAVLLKCALLNLAAFAVAMPAKAEDLVIDANSSKIINKTDTCSGGSCGGSYNKLNMTGGEFKIDRLNTDNDSVSFYFSDASTISGGKLILSTPSDSSDDVDGISLSFGNGLTVTGSDTVLDFSGTTMIDLYDRNTKLSVTDATIYGHDTPTTSLFDVRGDASFTNTNIKLENSSLITWDDAISQKGETKTQEEYNRLSETDKQKYAQDPHYYGSEGQYREKIQLPESLGGGYPSDKDTIKYDLFKEIYTDRPDQTLNFTKGTLSLKDSDVVGGKNIILDGTEVTMNHSLIGPLSENNVAGKKLSNNLTIKENARLTAENKSVLLAGNFWSEYNQIGEYLVEKGIKTNAEILASIKPIASKANINIEGNAQVNLNDSSAIVLLDKNEGQVNLSGGQLNMNDKSSVFGQVVINGGKLNVNGQNSVKTRADFIVTPASETNNAELVFINESGDYYGFSAIDGTAPAINLQSGAINLNGTLTADINATGGTLAFNSANARLNGAIYGAVDIKFNDDFTLSKSTITGRIHDLGDVAVADGEHLTARLETFGKNLPDDDLNMKSFVMGKNAKLTLTGNASLEAEDLDIEASDKVYLTGQINVNNAGVKLGNIATANVSPTGTYAIENATLSTTGNLTEFAARSNEDMVVKNSILNFGSQYTYFAKDGGTSGDVVLEATKVTTSGGLYLENEIGGNIRFTNGSTISLNASDNLIIGNEKNHSGKGSIIADNSSLVLNGTKVFVGQEADDALKLQNKASMTANGTVSVKTIDGKTGLISVADSSLNIGGTLEGNVSFIGNGTLNLSGALNGDMNIANTAEISSSADAFSKIRGTITNNGTISLTGGTLGQTLSGKIKIAGNTAFGGSFTTNDITISAGKTLDIGENSLTASTIAGGTISAILTDAAKNTAIVTAKASNVTLKLDMSQASRDKATRYKITNGTGFTFGDYAANRYAVSASEFDKTNAKTLEKLSGWNGGDLWILRLATASEAAIEDLEKSGVVLPENEKNASKILDLASGILDKLPEHRKKVIEKVNDLLDKAQGKAEEIKQILREIAPDTSTSGSKTASNTAKSVINVINSRFGGGSPRRGRSGGDYTVGQTAVWAQGMMNYAKLDTDNGFNAHSNGFAAGFEANFTDSFKAGLGYAYTSTDISTERSKTDVKTHTGFVYGEYKPNKAYINGVVSFGRSDYDDTTRSLSLPSAYKTDTIAAQIAAGYKAGVLTPEAAVRFTNVKQKAYTDATGAKMSEKTADTWTGVLGAKIGKNYMLRANRKIGLSPELKVAATYDFARDDENRTVTLPDGSSYTATGEAMERFGVEAGAGVTVSIANSAEIALTYDGKFKKDYQDHTGMVNLKIKF